MEPAHLGVQAAGYPGHRLGAGSFAQYRSYYFPHSACTDPSQEHLPNKVVNLLLAMLIPFYHTRLIAPLSISRHSEMLYQAHFGKQITIPIAIAIPPSFLQGKTSAPVAASPQLLY